MTAQEREAFNIKLQAQRERLKACCAELDRVIQILREGKK